VALTAQQLADLAAWIDQYAAQTAQLSEQAAAAMVAAYSGVNFYNAAAVAAAAEQAADTSNTAAVIAAGLAAEYLALISSQVAGTAIGVPNLPPFPVRNGVPLERVYERPIKFFRRQVSKGVDPAKAFEQAMRLAATLADSDIRLSQRDVSNRVLTRLEPLVGITGYRRVVRPELSRTGTCGLCVVASDRIYKTGTLLPMHDRCKCVVMPIIGDLDPGNSFNNLSLQELYSNADSNLSRELKATRYVVADHGEKGPVLVYADQQFTGVDDLDGYDLLSA
jgi:hypothetical protein